MKTSHWLALSCLTLSASLAQAAEIKAPPQVLAAPSSNAQASLRALDPDAAHNFETLPLGSNDSRYCIPFIKIGNSNPLLRPPAIEGANADNFLIPEDFCEQDCRQFTREVLANSQICKIPVIFRPSSVGDKQAVLLMQLDTEGPATQYALIGVGYAPEAAPAKENPKMIDAGAGASKDQVVEKESVSKNTTPSAFDKTPTPSSSVGQMTNIIPSGVNLPLIPKAIPSGSTEGKDGSKDGGDKTPTLTLEQQCEAYRQRYSIVNNLNAQFFAPGSAQPNTPRSAADIELGQRCAQLQRETAAVRQAALENVNAEAAARACMDDYDTLQQLVGQRNAAADNCSRTRQACLNADQIYQDCVSDFGTSLASVLTFNAVNCNDEHRAKAAACSPEIFAPFGVNTVEGVRRMQCAAFNTQNSSDPICQSYRAYHAGNCPSSRGPLEMEDRIRWYCQ